MQVTGVIAEFNPFHKGHAFFLEQIRKQTHADYIVAVISGNFVQRGMPAIANKYLRTRMALAGGADFVFELPTVWACSSAEDFARGGVRLLQQLGIVNTIGFGTESDDLSLLSETASLLSEEPKDYQTLLKQFLSNGYSFPTARMMAVSTYQQKEPSAANLLSFPNNILGIEYLKAIQYFHADIQATTLKRQGNYHADNYPVSAVLEEPSSQFMDFAGASEIRQALENEEQLSDFARQQLPATSVAILEEYWGKNTPVNMEMYYPYLSLTLLQNWNHLTDFVDFSPELANRLHKIFTQCNSMDMLIQALKTRQYTYTRICRALLHVFLNIKTDIFSQWKTQEYIPYARLLGFRKEASPVFRLLKEQAHIPILSKLTKDIVALDDYAKAMLDYDIYAADQYELICRNHWHTTSSKNEFSQGISKVR